MESSHSRVFIAEDRFAPYTPICTLGARPLPVYVARPSAPGAGPTQLVVAERFVGAGAAAGADLQREARRISTLVSPNLARVREVAVRGDDLVVFGDFIDGEKLGSVWCTDDRPSLEIVLRFLLDVLAGVGALHGLRDTRQQPMKLTHGEISPTTVLVALDGVARVLHAVARRAADVRADASSFDYLAPEIHASGAHDGRADVFSVGVLLWEALEGRPLSSKQDGPAGLRVRSGALAPPTIPERTPWAKALVPVAVKALAAAPDDRWPTAGAMAAEIRKAAGLKIAPASVATAFAKNRFGDRAKARRARFESMSASFPAVRAVSVAPAPVIGPDESAPAIVLDSLRPEPEPETVPMPLVAPSLVPAIALPVARESLGPPRDAPSIIEISDVFEEPSHGGDVMAPASVVPPFAPVFAVSTSLPTIEGPPASRLPRRRRVAGIAAVLGAAIVSVIALRAFHKSEPSTPAVPPVAVLSPSPSPPPAASSLTASPAPSPSSTPSATSSAAHLMAPRTKPATRTKVPPQHTKPAAPRLSPRKPASG